VGTFRFLGLFLVSLLLAVLLTGCSLDRNAQEPRWLVLLTTPEVEASGLLSVVVPPYEKANNVRVKRLTVDTKKSLEYADLAGIDVLLLPAGSALDSVKLTGAPARFPPFQAQPFPTPTTFATPDAPPPPVNFALYYERQTAFWSSVVLLIPKDLDIGKPGNVADALKLLWLGNRTIYAPSPTAEPGLHDLHERLWKIIGRFEPKDRGTGYKQLDADMLTLLKRAATDKAALLVPLDIYLKASQDDANVRQNLKIGFAGDNALYLPYEIAVTNNVETTDRDVKLAYSLALYLRNQNAQQIIAGHKAFGSAEPLYRPYYFPVYVPPR
jgi:ABC-type tungstate transport system permease subunit